MAQPGYGPNYPSTAYILSLIAGILILLGGLAEAAEAAFVGSALLGLFPGIAILLIVLGVIALIFGLVVLYGALQLKSHPQSARGWGILILIFSLISFIGGGGFFIGAILGIIGGILAMVWSPPAPAPGYGQPYGQPMQGQPMAAAPPAWGQPSVTSAPPPGAAAQKFCAHCGAPNASTAQFCAKCGAPMGP